MLRRWRWFLMALLLLIVSPIFGEDISTLPIGQRAVIDTAQVLSPPEHTQLENQMRQMHATGALQPALVIVKTTDGKELFDYSMEIFNRWQLGDANKNNGLLMVIAVKDRKYRMVTGYGLEGELADAYLSKIQREHLPSAFREQKYAQGISQVFGEIERRMALPVETRQQLFAQEKAAQEAENKPMSDEQKTAYGVALFLLMITAILHNSRVVSRLLIVFGGALLITPILFYINRIAGLSEDGPIATFCMLYVIAIMFHYILVLLTKPICAVFGWCDMDIGVGSGGSSGDSSSSRSSSSYSGGSSDGGYSGGGGRSGGGGAGGSW